jgi:hypothetical protein
MLCLFAEQAELLLQASRTKGAYFRVPRVAVEGYVRSEPGSEMNRLKPSIVFPALACAGWLAGSAPNTTGQGVAGASDSQPGFAAAGAVDRDRFASGTNHAWKGTAGRTNWVWQFQFAQPREVGAILQIQGDHAFVFQNAPETYVWQYSADGQAWHDLSGTRIERERRLFRVHRLAGRRRAQFLRLQISGVNGDFPTVREVEFYENRAEKIAFPDWIVAVNTTDDRRLPNQGEEFIPLARGCAGWETLQAQQVWLDSFDEAFCAVEPRPLCAFLSGNFKDWCEVDREPWRGTQEILKRGQLPLWASCGGAQGLAILAERGVDQDWDCPHCRDPQHPKNPIYTHIGHTGTKPCGDYSACIFERGPHTVRQLTHDPAFIGLPDQFEAMESHCGQIEWPPAGWELVIGAGAGTLTKTQCLKVKDHCIYAAQFHIEMAGTAVTSRRIMGNFLRLAKQWESAHADGK